MVIYSNKKKWYKEFERLNAQIAFNRLYFSISRHSPRYIICEKQLFRRHKILGTNIRIKPNDHIVDITTKRYGEEFCGSYLFESQYGTFGSMTSAETAAILISNLPIYKKGKNYIKYFFKHIELAEIEIPFNADVIDGQFFVKNEQKTSIYCVLTKEFNVLQTRKINL